MATKRALVVDDSRTARQSLAKLLIAHDLEVDFAETGEEALAFLTNQLVDVVFMDHTMPGMDGLQAVSAIKSNPRTATIPVMMYTTKEGEVYVSQARALGAVGVLPKQFHPGVLFGMLAKLGLVADRRSAGSQPEGSQPEGSQPEGSQPESPQPEGPDSSHPDVGPPSPDPQPSVPRRRILQVADDVDREYEKRAMGASVEALVTRVLEEQHVKLRSDVLASQRSFARQVAEEIIATADSNPAATQPLPSPRRAAFWRRAAAATAATAVAMLIAIATLLWQVRTERDSALLEIARMNTASRNEVQTLLQRSSGQLGAIERQRNDVLAQRAAALRALEWSLNQAAPVPFHQPPFGDPMAARLETLLTRLQDAGFRGSVSLTAHLGRFCMDRDDSGELRLAHPDKPVETCEIIGHPLQDVASIAALQSIAFADVVTSPSRPAADFRLVLGSEIDTSPAANVTTAGDWNAIMAKANRVEFRLIAERRTAAPPATDEPLAGG